MTRWLARRTFDGLVDFAIGIAIAWLAFDALLIDVEDKLFEAGSKLYRKLEGRS